MFGKKETSVVDDEPVKFCKDCEHFELNMFYEKYAKQCKHAKCMRISENIDIVRGGKHAVNQYCSIERGRDCGKEAKYFEPRKDDVSGNGSSSDETR